MDWRIVVILVVAGVVLLVVVGLGFAYHGKRKQMVRMTAERDKWRGMYTGACQQIATMGDLIRQRNMTDEEVYDELHERIKKWSVDGPPGPDLGDVPGGSGTSEQD